MHCISKDSGWLLLHVIIYIINAPKEMERIGYITADTFFVDRMLQYPLRSIALTLGKK